MNALDSEFFKGWSGYQLSLVLPNFRLNNFSEFFHLPSTLDSEFLSGMLVGTNFFGSCQIWGQKIFRIFSFTECSGMNLSEGGLGQLFLAMPNLRPKMFQISSFTHCSGLWIFFGYAKLEVKNFFKLFHFPSTLDCEFFIGGLGTNFSWSCQIWDQKFFSQFFSFTEHSGLNFSKGVSRPTFFSHPTFETKNFFWMYSFTAHSGLNFSEGVSRSTFFGHAKFDIKNFFEIFLFTEQTGL